MLISFMILHFLLLTTPFQIQAQSLQEIEDTIFNVYNLDDTSTRTPISLLTPITKPVVISSSTSTEAPVNNSPSNPIITKTSQPATNFIGCPNGQECVPSYLCRNGLIITDGALLIDIKFGGDNNTKECPNLETCCSLKDKVDKPLITPYEIPAGCGYRNIDGIAFKISGDENQETQFGEFPWMTAILEEVDFGDNIFKFVYKCGASLIHPSVILTAAHCVDGKNLKNFIARAGEWDTQTTAELLPYQDRNVVKAIVHENYHRGALFNDLALVFVDQPFKIVENVKTVCLPPANHNFDYARCYATGWGKNTFGQNGKYQEILKKVDLPIIPRGQCQNDLRQTRLGNYFELHNSFICAGGERGKDTCTGDGGSPLVCPIKGLKNRPLDHDRYYQAGIVAWGIGCGEGTPGVYTNVAKLKSWIDEKFASEGIDTDAFTP